MGKIKSGLETGPTGIVSMLQGTGTTSQITNTGSQAIFAANENAVARFVFNAGTTGYWLSLSNPATAANSFVLIAAGQLLEITEITAAIHGIQASGTPDIRATEVV